MLIVYVIGLVWCVIFSNLVAGGARKVGGEGLQG